MSILDILLPKRHKKTAMNAESSVHSEHSAHKRTPITSYLFQHANLSRLILECKSLLDNESYLEFERIWFDDKHGTAREDCIVSFFSDPHIRNELTPTLKDHMTVRRVYELIDGK